MTYLKYIKFSKFSLLLLCFLAVMQSCIKNDIPYPVEVLTIEEIAGEGFTMKMPNYSDRIITLELEEQTDPAKVVVESATYSSGATLSEELVATHDLRSPKFITLSLYQDYEWQIVANQEISRSFKVDGQVGEEIIDTANNTVLINVSAAVDLSEVNVTEMKLGPSEVTQYSLDIEEMSDFNNEVVVEVTYHGNSESWKITIERTDMVIDLTKCDIWVNNSWLTAAGDTSLDCGFKYRKSNDADWIVVDKDDIEFLEGSFSAEITGLTPNTEYEFVAYADSNISNIYKGYTESIITLENGDFEGWSKPAKSWYPFNENDIEFWGSGNPGATTLSEKYNLTTPDNSDVRPGTNGVYAAKLQSRNVIIKFAAGSIYVGRYVKTAGTNGIVGFGQPFTSYPKALKGWFKYSNGAIDVVGSDTPESLGIEKNVTMDQGMIYAALGTWTPQEYGYSSYESEMQGSEETPLIVDTRDKSTFFDSSSKDVVAYGEMVLTKGENEWIEFTIPLNYNTTSVQPTHIMIVCSASRYGDYFTGSTSSVLYLDDFELVY